MQSESDTAADRWVEVGLVARPHGVQGELRVSLHNKESEVLFHVDEVLVRLANGDEHEVSVDGVRPADQAVLLRLHSIGDRDRAEELRGAKLFVKRSQFAPLETASSTRAISRARALSLASAKLARAKLARVTMARRRRWRG